MEITAETEAKIIQIVKDQYDKDKGANGIDFGSFGHFLNMPLLERNALISRLADEKKIQVFQSLNGKRITMPK
ncbi:hypothetical protein [Chryseobacterium sp.]|uniref:hypothetical protein n=1 Tax=Chryseobacterium sp. TaxID=1871047 RepID=UPI00289CBB5E|nr:hypothetical protein [Chryseobacterium sp.]